MSGIAGDPGDREPPEHFDEGEPMTQGEKVGRGGDREAIRALDAVIFEKIEGVPWLAKHILAAIREGKVPGIVTRDAALAMSSSACEELQKEVAELRAKVGEVERSLSWIRGLSEAACTMVGEDYGVHRDSSVAMIARKLTETREEMDGLAATMGNMGPKLIQAEAERDEALGLLRECRFIMAAGTVFTGDRYIDRGALRDRIDAFLRESP